MYLVLEQMELFYIEGSMPTLLATSKKILDVR